MKAKYLNLDSSKQEIMENISEFPISCDKSRFTSNTYDFIDWHWHVEFQLCLIIHGTVIWGTNSQQTPVSAGEGIFINSQRAHMAKPFGENVEFFCVNFSPNFLCMGRQGKLYENYVHPILNHARLDRKVIQPQTVAGTEILSMLSKMENAFDEKEDGYEFELAGNLFKIWKNLYELLKIDGYKSTSLHDDRFQKILMYLQRNYAEEISLNSIAAYIGLSRSECCRYFKKQSGQTISDYLLQYRIHKSMECLKGTEDTIAQIAQDCGFSYQSYYTKRFRELTGITPKQYRFSQKGK